MNLITFVCCSIISIQSTQAAQNFVQKEDPHNKNYNVNDSLKENSDNNVRTKEVDSLSYLIKQSPKLLLHEGRSYELTVLNNAEDSLSFQQDDDLPKWHSFITNIPNDMVRFYKDQFTSDNIPKYLGIAALTAGLLFTDERTYRESERFYNRTQFNKNFSVFFKEMGDGRTQFALAGAFGIYGFVAKDNRAVRTASQIVEAVLAAGTVVQVLKHITGRESPFLETKPGGAWRFFPNQIDYHKHVPAYDAYPSGHIATSMAAFIVIVENYPEIKWLRPASYVFAGLIGFGMANDGIHWYSDYPLGIALGYTFGKLIAHPEPDVKDYDSDKKVSVDIFPYFNRGVTGLSLNFNF